MATVLQEEDALLDTIATEALHLAVSDTKNVTYSAQRLLGERPAVLRRVLRLAARIVMGPNYDLGIQALSEVEHLLTKFHGSHRIDLPGGLQAVSEYGQLRFIQLNSPKTGPSEWYIKPQGLTEIPELGLRVLATPENQPEMPVAACFDQDLLPGPLAIRFRTAGDRIYPMGMNGSKKLQDILVDAKIPQRIRNRIPLLTSGNEVCWLIGFRLDRRFLATNSTRNPLQIRVSKGEGEA